MLIRSQDGRWTVNLNLIEAIHIYDLCHDKSLDLGNQVLAFSGAPNDDGIILGEYSAEEEAMKVLDKIELAYNSRQRTFKMPQDEEV